MRTFAIELNFDAKRFAGNRHPPARLQSMDRPRPTGIAFVVAPR
jgi:hypothetical protein